MEQDETNNYFKEEFKRAMRDWLIVQINRAEASVEEAQNHRGEVEDDSLAEKLWERRIEILEGVKAYFDDLSPEYEQK